MSLKNNKKRGSVTVLLPEDLTVGRVTEIRSLLKEALDESQNLEVNTENAAEVDLTFLQLMCSLHRTALSLNKSVRLTAPSNPALEKAVADNGYRRARGCHMDTTNTCLWTENNDE